MAYVPGSVVSQILAAAQTSAQLPVPSSPVAGQIFVAYLFVRSSDLANTFTIPTGFALHADAGQSQGSTRGRLMVYWKRLDGTETGTFDWTWPTSTTREIAGASFSGRLATGDPWHVPSSSLTSATSTTTTAAIPAITPFATSGDLVAGVCTNDGAASGWTPPAGMTEIYDRGAAPALLSIAYQDAIAPGSTGTKTFTSLTTGGYPRGVMGVLLPPPATWQATGSVAATSNAAGAATIYVVPQVAAGLPVDATTQVAGAATILLHSGPPLTAYDIAALSLPGVLRYWPLKDVSGTTAVDYGGSVNGTYTATGIAYSVPGLLVGGQVGVQTSGTGEITLPTTGLTGPGTIFGYINSLETGTGWILRDHSTGSGGTTLNLFDADVRWNGGANQNLETSTARDYIAHGRKFAVITWDGANGRAYIDGVLRVTFATAMTFANLANPLHLGRNGNAVDYTPAGFAGFGFVNRAITQAEVDTLYAAGRVPQIGLYNRNTANGFSGSSSTVNAIGAHAAGQRLLLVAYAKPDTVNTTPTINNGWTLVKRLTGGTGVEGTGTGAMSCYVFAKDAVSGAEAIPTISWPATAPAAGLSQVFVMATEPGYEWADAIGANVNWITGGSDTVLANPLTATLDPLTNAPTAGDTILLLGGMPGNSGSAVTAGTTTASATSATLLLGNRPTYIESSTGTDSAQCNSVAMVGAGTATSDLTASFTITSSTDSSGLVVAILLRQQLAVVDILPASGSIAATSAAAGTVRATFAPTGSIDVIAGSVGAPIIWGETINPAAGTVAAITGTAGAPTRVLGPPAPPASGTQRWTLTEKGTATTWTMPVNPNTMSDLPELKQLVTISSVIQNRARTFQTPAVAQELTWGGVILSQQHYDDLLLWSRKAGVIVIVDHLQRSFEVLISQFRPAPEAGRRPGDPKQTYTITALFLRRTA
jgi:hypothetical protein